MERFSLRATRGAALLLLAVCCALASCGGGGAKRAQNERPAKSDFERSLDTVRTSQHAKIYVFRRPDGQRLSTEDRQALRDIKPMQTGMWVLTQDGTTAIAGAGFEFEPQLLQDLSKRFTVEDYTNR